MTKKLQIANFSVLYILAAFLLHSCQNKNKNTVQKSFTFMINTIIDTTDSGIFRGVNLGDNYTDVANKESVKNLFKKDSSMLHYKIQISDSVQYDITYQFHKKALNNIKFIALLPSEKDGAEMTQMLKDKYKNQYNAPKKEKAYLSWHTEDSLYIQLINNSEQYGYGMVQLYIYKDFSSNFNEQTDSAFKSPFL